MRRYQKQGIQKPVIQQLIDFTNWKLNQLIPKNEK